MRKEDSVFGVNGLRGRRIGVLGQPTQPIPQQPKSQSANFVASEYADDKKKHLLLAASGSVATIKLPNIVNALSSYDDLSIRIIITKSAENFLAGQSEEQPHLESLLQEKNVDGIYRDEDEWKKPWVRGDVILHIELRRWADILVIAPLSCNSMAKMTMGIADNLVLSVVRAWDTTGEIEGSKKKRIVVCPAMNTGMWKHPVTRKQLKVLEGEWGWKEKGDGWVEVLRPVEKELACGDSGNGAMREWSKIVWVIKQRLSLKDETKR
jgi:phosphopantothenoylcysteine decarboxylase